MQVNKQQMHPLTSNVGNEINKANAESESKIIAEVMADLIDDICKAENKGRDSNAENRRGRDKRKTYTNEFKYQVILEASSDTSLYDIVAEKYGISKFLIAKGKINRDELENTAAEA